MADQQKHLDEQQPHWEEKFTANDTMFGEEPSQSAVRALKTFKEKGCKNIIELGAGQGRDTLYFAQNGLHVTVLDYSYKGIEIINQRAEELGVADQIESIYHDVRQPFSLEAASYDGCYSHMLYCMAITTEELIELSSQVHRVLKSGGINIFTARNRNDVDYNTGIKRGDNLFEVGTFIIHFFDEETINKVSEGFEVTEVWEFEEGGLPRTLWMVTQEKVQ